MNKFSVEIEELEEYGLTPNQYYLAYLIKQRDLEAIKKLKTLYKKELQFNEDLLTLAKQNYLKTSDGSLTKVVLKDCSIVDIFEDLEPKTDWDTFVSQFRDIFPKGTMTSGFYVRSSYKDCSKKLAKFIKEYGFDEETILKATKSYVDRFRLKNYSYMKTASYFILKDKESVLASECEMVNDSDAPKTANSLLSDGLN